MATIRIGVGFTQALVVYISTVKRFSSASYSACAGSPIWLFKGYRLTELIGSFGYSQPLPVPRFERFFEIIVRKSASQVRSGQSTNWEGGISSLSVLEKLSLPENIPENKPLQEFYLSHSGLTQLAM